MARMYISFGEHFRASGPMQVGELLFDQTSLLFYFFFIYGSVPYLIGNNATDCRDALLN